MEALARGKPEVFNTVQGCKSTSLEFTQVSRDRGVRISMGGKRRYSDNIFVERLWRTLKYDEVYLEAYADTHEVCKGLEDYFRFHNQLGPHESLGYRTPGEVFHGEQGVVDGKSNGRRCSLDRGSNHWPESRDSRLNRRRSCPNNRVHLTPGVSGSDPETQNLQLLQAGVDQECIYRDVGVSETVCTNSRKNWHRLDRKLVAGDTLVVVAVDRIGRRWQDTMRCILSLNARGGRIRSLDPMEARWTAYLDAEPDSVEAFQGHLMMLFGAWVADQESAALRRRTKSGLERAMAQGKTLGGPRKLRAEDYREVVRMQEAGLFLPEIGKRLGVSKKTVVRFLKAHQG